MSRVALVVDDSMLIRHAVCRFLEERGFAVESATNGVEALELLEKLRPDIIITDLSMPRMSGSELITALKSRPETHATPIVVLAARQTTSHGVPESRADLVIYKDIDIQEQLHAAIAGMFTTTLTA
ncbi:MAG TPA: response regulator [Clostridia bacterium]|nr:response regulator [Clostridia bacterium]